jgi:hypothetical protein
MAPLLRSKIIVLNQIIDGRWRGTHRLLVARRKIKALAMAMKNMTMERMPRMIAVA